MPGPLSTPNGDVRIIRGHVNEAFVCHKHGEKELDKCYENEHCKIVPLRDYLFDRSRLVTGKTR
jgi:hypothetical protein